MAPAAFRKDLGPVVGSIKIHNNVGVKMRVDVYGLYRDGAYVAGAFEVENTGDRDYNYVFNSFAPWQDEFVEGSELGGFTVIDPSNKSRYFALRGGGPGSSFIENRVLYLEPGMKQRGIVYFPAPPDNVKKVTLDLEDFGTVENVPVG